MFRRRRRDEQVPRPEDPEAAGQPAQDAQSQDDAQPAEPGEEPAAAKSDRTHGPFDVSELDHDEAQKNRIDLGSMLIRGVAGMKIQLQVDKRSGQGTSVLLGLGDAAVQLVVVAAPRSSGLWEQTRLQIAADAKQRGGNAQEGPGPFGTEVRVVVPVTTKDGKQGHQASRISGVDGPRWMLRATFLGKAISDAAAFQRLVEVAQQVVVVRGDNPMPPGEVIALRPPAQGETGEGDAVPTVTDSAAEATDAGATGTNAAGDTDTDATDSDDTGDGGPGRGE